MTLTDQSLRELLEKAESCDQKLKMTGMPAHFNLHTAAEWILDFHPSIAKALITELIELRSKIRGESKNE